MKLEVVRIERKRMTYRRRGGFGGRKGSETATTTIYCAVLRLPDGSEIRTTRISEGDSIMLLNAGVPEVDTTR